MERSSIGKPQENTDAIGHFEHIHCYIAVKRNMSIFVGLSLLSMAPLKQKNEQLFATYSSFTDTGPVEGFSDGADFSLLFV